MTDGDGRWFAWRPVRLTVDGGVRWLCHVNRQRERLWGQTQFYYSADPEAYEPTALDWVMRAYLAACILAGIADLVGRCLGRPPLGIRAISW